MYPKAGRHRPSRGRGVDATGRSIGGERHLRLPHYMLKSPAWISLDPVARCLFVEVAQRYNGHNNGEIGLGVREAGAALHVRPQTAGRAFDTLRTTGFLRVGRDSAFNMKSRLTREWIVTLFPLGNDRASHDFMRWTPSHSESSGQMRKRTPTVANEDTVGKKRTSNSVDTGHRECETSLDNGGLNRITSISHRIARRLVVR